MALVVQPSMDRRAVRASFEVCSVLSGDEPRPTQPFDRLAFNDALRKTTLVRPVPQPPWDGLARLPVSALVKEPIEFLR